LFCADSWQSEELNPSPAAGRLQQQQKLLNIIERLLSSYGTTSANQEQEEKADDDDDDDDYEWANDAVVALPEQLSSRWRQVVVDDGVDVAKRLWSTARRNRPLKRGPGMCINSCLTGGMSFVRCKSMCHW